MSSIRLVSGSVDSGKTAFLMSRSRLPGRAAWLSVKEFVPGEADSLRFLGYDLVLYPAVTQIPLARLDMDGETDQSWFPFRRFFFNSEAFSTALDYLAAVSSTTEVVEFLLDEVGPLEMEGGGFATLLSALLGTGTDLVLSVRPSLTEAIQERFAFRAVEIISL